MLFDVYIAVADPFADNSKLSDIFSTINKPTSLGDLESAIQYYVDSDTMPSALNQIQETQTYLEKNTKSLFYLRQALKLPPVNFTCYNEHVKPGIILFTTKIPACMRLIMLDFEYNVCTGQRDKIASSFTDALKLDSLIANIPYLYGQLLRSSNLYIIFKKLRAISIIGGLDDLNVQECDDIIYILKNKEIEFTSGYKNVLLAESQIDNSHISDFLKSRVKPDVRIEDYNNYINKYKQLCKKLADTLDLPSTPAWNEILKDSEEFNGYFSCDVVTPAKWKDRYQNTILEIKTMRILFEALKFKKLHGIFPESLEQFIPDLKSYNNTIFTYSSSGNNLLIIKKIDKNDDFIYKCKEE